MPKPKQSLAEPTTVAAYVEAITRALQARGADPDEVLREIDVLRIHGNDPLVRITDSTVNAIYARAAALTGDEYFGLRVAEHIVPGTLHALGYALLASDTLEDFCHRFVRYYGLVSQSADLRVLVEGQHVQARGGSAQPRYLRRNPGRLGRPGPAPDADGLSGRFLSPRRLDLRRPVAGRRRGAISRLFRLPGPLRPAAPLFSFRARRDARTPARRQPRAGAAP
jgi:hypothetical protein